MNYCSKCGEKLMENVEFCPKCGNKVNDLGNDYDQNTYMDNTKSYKGTITRREIAISLILSLVTCGIYSIYWFIMLTEDSNKLSDEEAISGGMAFLFSLLTCGIYQIYWNYKMGKKMYEVGKKYSHDISDNSILYLILSIFGLGIINYCLIQNDLNKFC